MKVFTDFSCNYRDDPIEHMRLEDYPITNPDIILSVGSAWNATRLRSLKQEHPTKQLYCIDLEEPIPVAENMLETYQYADRIFMLCKDTAKYYNRIFGGDKARPMWFPVNEKFAAHNPTKLYDVIYVGETINPAIQKIVDDMKKYNYKHLGLTHGTDRYVPYAKKMELISQSKVAVVHNLVWLWKKHIDRIHRYPDYLSNPVYKRVDVDGKIPQLKCRVFESALSESLLMVQRDEWNIIEQYFEPGTEFVYYDPENFQLVLDEILANYDSKYKAVAQRARDRVLLQYTSRHFIEDVIK